MRKIYLVDWENVGFAHIDVQKEDFIYYFYSGNAVFEDTDCSEVLYIKHSGRKDAMDKLIISYVGFMIARFGMSAEVKILSNDLGYADVVEYWSYRGYKVSLMKCTNASNSLLQRYGKYFDDRELDKIDNIYCSWARSKALDYRVLESQIMNCFKKRDRHMLKRLSKSLYGYKMSIERSN